MVAWVWVSPARPPLSKRRLITHGTPDSTLMIFECGCWHRAGPSRAGASALLMSRERTTPWHSSCRQITYPPTQRQQPAAEASRAPTEHVKPPVTRFALFVNDRSPASIISGHIIFMHGFSVGACLRKAWLRKWNSCSVQPFQLVIIVRRLASLGYIQRLFNAVFWLYIWC